MIERNKIFKVCDKIVSFSFDEIWKIEGKNISNLSKKEIAEEMFFKGLAYMLDHVCVIEDINLNNFERKIRKNIENY